MKGYCNSVTLGIEMLVSLGNAIGGIVMMICSIVVMSSEVEILEGFMILAGIGITTGVFALLSGILALVGSCKEKVKCLKWGMIMSWIALLSGLAVVIYIYILSGNLSQTLSDNWNGFEDSQKETIEKAFSCCGWTNLREGTNQCHGFKTCEDPVTDDVQSKLTLLTSVTAVICGLQLAALICSSCVKGKMGKQQKKAKLKQQKKQSKEDSRVEKKISKMEQGRAEGYMRGYSSKSSSKH